MNQSQPNEGCGCEVICDRESCCGLTSHKIVYCPLHQAAGKLLEAAKQVVKDIEPPATGLAMDQVDKGSSLYLLKRAIQQAEAKP